MFLLIYFTWTNNPQKNLYYIILCYVKLLGLLFIFSIFIITSGTDIIIEDSSSNFSEYVNGPVDSYSSVNDNFSVSNNHVSNNNSSVLNEVFNFLLGGRCNNYNTREWKNLCKCQTKIGALSDTPLLTVTEALLNNIIPIAIGRQRLLLSRFKFNKS